MFFRSESHPNLTIYLGPSGHRVDLVDGVGEVTAPKHVKAMRDFIAEHPEFGLDEIAPSKGAHAKADEKASGEPEEGLL